MILIRFILISIIIFLIFRAFIRRGGIGEQPPDRAKVNEDDTKIINKKISKDVGEYVDYEELDK